MKAVLTELMGTWDWCHHHLILTQPEIFASPCPVLSLQRPRWALLAALALPEEASDLWLCVREQPPALSCIWGPCTVCRECRYLVLALGN